MGPALAAAWVGCEGEALGDPASRERFSGGLARWDQLGRQDRSEIVALGLRMCRSEAKPSTAKSPSRRAPRSGAVPTSGRSARTKPPQPTVGPGNTHDGGGDPRSISVSQLPGVGPAIAARLHAKGVETLDDLLSVLPASYVDHRVRRRPSEWNDGEVVTFDAQVISLRQGHFGGRFSATMELAVEVDGTIERIQGRWFQSTGGLARFQPGLTVVGVGQVRRFSGRTSVIHPQLRDPADPLPPISPRYPAIEGVPPKTLAKLILRALDRVAAANLPEILPLELLPWPKLPSRIEALRAVHQPAPTLTDKEFAALNQGVSAAHCRLALESFFWVQLAVARARQAIQSRPCAVTVPVGTLTQAGIRPHVPFEPTGAQWRVVEEIAEDLARGVPMMRLVQGDVGSGKTMVAFAAALAVAAAGGQTAVMAPTEILAEQHMATLTPWCAAAGLRVALLTGATASGPRESLLALCAAGQIDVLVGTHALLTDDVSFARLGLVVVDEQHRFGVEQRARLRGKGEQPHLLVMTATPIPRTLALTAYGELDVSVIDELPPGRTPAHTELLTGPDSLSRARDQLAQEVRSGAQAFVVCPLVEASDKIQVSDVEASAQALTQTLPDHRIGVIHGRLASREKGRIMDEFRRGDLAVLVATTVIEVGVDVPQATAILVEHAERFGLAQLHQLRGRVGRGGGQGRCWLHTAHGADSEVAARLRVLAEHADGFAVAEKDLALRGPGEVFGTAQSGVPRLRLSDLGGRGIKLLVAARQAAQGLLQRDPELAGGPWAAELARHSAEASGTVVGAG